MKKIQLALLAGILMISGGAIFCYKYFVLEFPLDTDTTTLFWDIEMRLSFDARDKPVKASLFLPGEDNHYFVNSEHFLSGKYGLISQKKNGNRKAVWSVRKASGRQHLYYRVQVQQAAAAARKEPSQKIAGPVSYQKLSGLNLVAAQEIWKDVYHQSSDMDTIIGNLFNRLEQGGTDENVSLLLGNKKGSTLQKMKAAAQVLSIEGIPSQLVYGINLKKESKAAVVNWLEVFYQKKWRAYNPEGALKEIPDTWLTWWRGSEPLYKVSGGTNTQVQITVQKNETEAIQKSIRQSKLISPQFYRFSLLNLPVQNQIVYRVMLLMPVGALLVVLLRNVIGLQTFGTFMPVLIALSFRETQLIWGVVLFGVVVAVGLMIRFFLESLKLLVVPRLAAVLICVIIIIAWLNILTNNLGLSLGLSVSLFPIVILSMAIERMSILWDERGADEAFKQGAGTMLSSIIIYFVIRNQTIEHVMFYFPELILIILAFTFLLGRYSGFRLFELYRFKEFSGKPKHD